MPRKQHLYHYIYKTTCLVNGKYYVGMHSTSNLEDGYIGSGKRLWLSIRKHGRENFKFEILEWYPDRSSLKSREKELVNEELLRDPHCMNLKPGGEGGWTNEEHRKAAIRISSPIVGKIWQEKHVRRLNEDAEYYEKFCRSIKNAHREKKMGFNGKKHSDESKKKIGEANSISQRGERNSQFGKKWIHSEIEKKSMLVSNPEDFIEKGWKLGRKR